MFFGIIRQMSKETPNEAELAVFQPSGLPENDQNLYRALGADIDDPATLPDAEREISRLFQDFRATAACADSETWIPPSKKPQKFVVFQCPGSEPTSDHRLFDFLKRLLPVAFCKRPPCEKQGFGLNSLTRDLTRPLYPDSDPDAFYLMRHHLSELRAGAGMHPSPARPRYVVFEQDESQPVSPGRLGRRLQLPIDDKTTLWNRSILTEAELSRLYATAVCENDDAAIQQLERPGELKHPNIPSYKAEQPWFPIIVMKLSPYQEKIITRHLTFMSTEEGVTTALRQEAMLLTEMSSLGCGDIMHMEIGPDVANPLW